ncbi:FAD-dependent oxidoreductase [Cryobacterium sp. Hh7]|uniref:FAD-dependent oxidoreductase n=1 Tax=Cryobacterium sp. Hh7 TaxID=1259159 RepID=UPI0018E07E3B|nr:FAD-dependent oxidoreductase [Cryobacterium sp. Hh7]
MALNAATRGLTVVTVAAHDLAFGTSRWSSKLEHRGRRYLANGQLLVARECAVERGILLTRTAPHPVHPLPMVLPLGPMVVPEQGASAAVGLGAHTPLGALPAPRRLSPAEALELAPELRRQGLRPRD